MKSSKRTLTILFLAVALAVSGLVYGGYRWTAHAQQTPKTLTAKQALRINNRLIEARLAQRAFNEELAVVKKEQGVDDTWQPVNEEGTGIVELRPATPEELKIIEQQKTTVK